jgi:hypothetical protein
MQTKAPSPNETFLTFAELGARWKQATQTIHNKASAGTLGVAVVRIGGTEPRVRLRDVVAAEELWTAPLPGLSRAARKGAKAAA